MKANIKHKHCENNRNFYLISWCGNFAEKQRVFYNVLFYTFSPYRTSQKFIAKIINCEH